MKQIKKASSVKDGLHFLRRNGGWFRPDAAGYTDDITEAGTYTADVVRDYLEKCEGVTAVTVASMKHEIWCQVGDKLRQAGKLSELAMRL